MQNIRLPFGPICKTSSSIASSTLMRSRISKIIQIISYKFIEYNYKLIEYQNEVFSIVSQLYHNHCFILSTYCTAYVTTSCLNSYFTPVLYCVCICHIFFIKYWILNTLTSYCQSSSKWGLNCLHRHKLKILSAQSISYYHLYNLIRYHQATGALTGGTGNWLSTPTAIEIDPVIFLYYVIWLQCVI